MRTPAPTSRALQAPASRPTSVRPIEANASASQELQLIERALQALHDHELDRAEHALHEHATRFASGTLAEERLGLQVIVACSRGDTAAAEPLRVRFLARAPDSPLAAKIARACAR